ncbi:MAG: hypothetical protein EBY21_04960, partial [Alphaproteobacteria bacterium]|nr:hypothetical protein [Alphaproteobacteria bacterium]
KPEGAAATGGGAASFLEGRSAAKAERVDRLRAEAAAIAEIFILYSFEVILKSCLTGLAEKAATKS